MKQPGFRTIALLGVGLIGGSLGLSLRRRMPEVSVVGFDKPAVARRAVARGAIDRFAKNLPSAVKNADVVILATPMAEILALLPEVARLVPETTVVTDVGSVKEPVMRKAARLFPAGNFVGGHPMAGLELTGIEAADPLLFENAWYVLTPLPRSTRRHIHTVARLAMSLGARPFAMDARTHDQVAAMVSHVPQLTAVALMNVAGRKSSEASQYLRLAAGGFRDLTRIASSKYALWSQILPANRLKAARALKLLIDELRVYERALRKNNLAQFESSFSVARKLRNSIPRDMKGFLRDLSAVRVFVPDQPGMLARITRVIARAKVNIKDIELMKVREGTGGTFRLLFSTRDEAQRAAKVLRASGFQVG